MSKDPFYKSYLRSEFARRRQDNARYSLRAFARALEVDPAGLSRNLSGQGRFSLGNGQKIADHLNLPAQTRRRFLQSIAEERSVGILNGDSSGLIENEIDPDVFSVISEWYHYGILELTYLKNFKPSPQWVAKQLGITVLEANLAISRLFQLGLLEKIGDGWKKTSARIKIKDPNSTSAAQKRYQEHVLRMAKESLRHDDIKVRNHSSITLPISKKKLAHAKEMIAEFSDELTRFLSSDNDCDEVYQLSVCLFPLKSRGL
jgi:hypothetical protein